MACNSVLRKLVTRLDRAALDQLRAEVARLAEENEWLRDRLVRSEECAEFWNDQAFELQRQLCELTDTTPGITQGGQLVAVPA